MPFTMPLWSLFTIGAAFAQAWRNALQNQLSKEVDAIGVTLARFLWAWPLALLYLGAIQWRQPQPAPDFSERYLFFIGGAAVAQILATILMVVLFKRRSFAAGVGLAKSEALLAAIVGVAFFGTVLTPLGWLGVLIGALAVWLLKGPGGVRFDPATILLGLACGLCFAVTSLWVREASLTSGLPYLHGAAWVLLCVQMTQCALLVAYLAVRNPATLRALWVRPGPTLRVSVASFCASACWFTAMSLEEVPIVKTLGQIEVMFTLLISWRWIKEPIARRDKMGLMLIAVAAICVLWS